MKQTKLSKSEVERLLEFLDIDIEPGSSTKESCPVTSHGKKRGDRDPSLLVKVAKNGSGTVKCYAGCSGEEIKIAVGIKKLPKQLPTIQSRPWPRRSYDLRTYVARRFDTTAIPLRSRYYGLTSPTSEASSSEQFINPTADG